MAPPGDGLALSVFESKKETSFARSLRPKLAADGLKKKTQAILRPLGKLSSIKEKTQRLRRLRKTALPTERGTATEKRLVFAVSSGKKRIRSSMLAVRKRTFERATRRNKTDGILCFLGSIGSGGGGTLAGFFQKSQTVAAFSGAAQENPSAGRAFPADQKPMNAGSLFVFWLIGN